MNERVTVETRAVFIVPADERDTGRGSSNVGPADTASTHQLGHPPNVDGLYRAVHRVAVEGPHAERLPFPGRY